MQLHEFMLPEVVAEAPPLLDISASPAPSNLFCGIDRLAEEILVGGKTYAFKDELSWADSINHGGKAHRRQVLFNGKFRDICKPFYIDFEDARYIPRDFTFGKDFNVFQYNRRKGDRTSVLWKLSSYFCPDASLGHRPKFDFSSEPDFDDKIEKVFWRGGISGSHWLNPDKRRGTPRLGIKTILDDQTRNLYSRFDLVFSEKFHDILDAKFSGNTIDVFVEDYLKDLHYFSDAVSPLKMLKYKYILCPAGNDVSSALYWIIGTQSLAFKEDVEYEVLPDFYLKPWVHFVPIAKGFMDLREKYDYCINNPELARRIVQNANQAYWKIRDASEWAKAEDIVLDRLGLMPE